MREFKRSWACCYSNAPREVGLPYRAASRAAVGGNAELEQAHTALGALGAICRRFPARECLTGGVSGCGPRRWRGTRRYATVQFCRKVTHSSNWCRNPLRTRVLPAAQCDGVSALLPPAYGSPGTRVTHRRSVTVKRPPVDTHHSHHCRSPPNPQPHRIFQCHRVLLSPASAPPQPAAATHP